MRDRHAQLGEHLALLLGEVGAMRHDGVLAQKAEVAQRVRIGLPETLEHHVVLPLTLVAMRLHVHVVLGGKIA